MNGTAIFSNWGGGTDNAYADMLAANDPIFRDQLQLVPAFRYLAEEFYGQDSWKVSRRLTMDYGLRVSHLGPWSDTTGFGFAAYIPLPTLPVKEAESMGSRTNFPRPLMEQSQQRTPLSGSASRTFFYNPRVGFAWDVFGTGKTVLRGGYGMSLHDEQNVQNGAYGISQGSFASPTLSGI